jgi:hypothetical protein
VEVTPLRVQPFVLAEERGRRGGVADGGVDRPAALEQPADEVVAVLAGGARDEGRTWLDGQRLDGQRHAVSVGAAGR